MSIDTLTEAPFAARLGATLTLEAADGALALEILAVRQHPLAAGPGAKRTPFNVILRGPESPHLPDGHYRLRSEEGGERWPAEPVFVNRIMPPANTDGRGVFYQIVFC